MTVAFQYTVREDDKFPTGLVSSDLTDDAGRRWPSGPPGAAAARTDRAAAPAGCCASATPGR